MMADFWDPFGSDIVERYRRHYAEAKDKDICLRITERT
jgi:hypothetical protein